MNASILHIEGLTPYAQGHRLQRALLNARIHDQIGDTLLCVEHTPTVTIGRARGSEQSVLSRVGDMYRVERGGDATWHGPGQLTVYPIVRLEGARADLHAYLADLEEAVIQTLLDAGLRPTRDERNTGVWLPSADGHAPRKVCSIGIACRKWVTWHGIALNICPDLGGFQRIQPCGMEQGVITRLCDHLEHCPDFTTWRSRLADALAAQLRLHAPSTACYADIVACCDGLELTLPDAPPPSLSADGLPHTEQHTSP